MIDLAPIRARDADYNDVFEAQASMSKDIAHRLVAWPVADRRALLAYVDELRSRLADQKGAADAYAARLASSDETGWLIEGAWSSSATPDYWVGSSVWSSNHNEALRFARRQDAQQAADLMCAGLNVRLCEHRWAKQTQPDTATHREDDSHE